MPIDQALSYAQQQGLDLVEVSPMSKPPVCKVMDYGKFKYEEKKPRLRPSAVAVHDDAHVSGQTACVQLFQK